MLNPLNKAKILIIDDASTNIIILNEMLKDSYELFTASNGADGIKLARQEHPDLILLDIEMPDMDGYEVCKQLKQDKSTEDILVIFITARSTQDDEIHGFDIGAVDYIIKPVSLPIVRARVKTHIELKQYRDILSHQATMDGLTGIPNRRRFNERVQQEWDRCLREQESLSIGIIDIDYFKKYNDSYGHLAGDDCLVKVAKTLIESITRATDMVARLGGEEFIFLLPNTDLDGAVNVAQKFRQNIENLHIAHENSDVAKYVTVSIGVSTIIPTAPITLKQFVDFADQQLYKAKSQGRNKIFAESFTTN